MNRATDDFDIGMRVRILGQSVCNGATGTVVGRDAYTVDIRLDVVTREMMGYEDSRTGVVSVEPIDLEILA